MILFLNIDRVYVKEVVEIVVLPSHSPRLREGSGQNFVQK